MSSDNFHVRIGAIQGDSVIFHCLTGFNGGYDDVASSRSFALGLLLDAKGRAGDVAYDVEGAPEDEARRLIGLADEVKARPSALHAALPDPQPWDRAWCSAHVPNVVASAKLLARHNELGEEALSAIVAEIEPLQDKGPWHHLEAAWRRLHRFDLEVKVVDPKYLAHLVPGHEFGTTAFDAWRE